MITTDCLIWIRATLLLVDDESARGEVFEDSRPLHCSTRVRRFVGNLDDDIPLGKGVNVKITLAETGPVSAVDEPTPAVRIVITNDVVTSIRRFDLHIAPIAGISIYKTVVDGTE